MPVADTASVPKVFINRRITGTSATVSGCDLVYSIPDSLANNTGSNVITIIPANPAYWTGTRIAQVAAGYQNYRPIQFEVVYVPQCAVTQQGNVIGGTLWNEVPTENNMQQTLKTSNGGMLTQCYKTATSIVRMKSNLQYNLYRMGGAIDQESNPFIYISLAIGCKDSNNNSIVPGYFYIRYTYVLKNPIGTGITYQNSQLTTKTAKQTYLLNASVYLCKKITTINGLEIPIGSRLDVEYDNNNNNPIYHYYYNGTPINANTLTNIWVLENQPNIPSNLASLRILKQPTEIKYGEMSETRYPDQIVEIPQGYGISYEEFKQGASKVVTILNNTVNTINKQFPMPNTKVYQIDDWTQDFGEVTEISPIGLMSFAKDLIWNKFVQEMSTKGLKIKLLPPINIIEAKDKPSQNNNNPYYQLNQDMNQLKIK